MSIASISETSRSPKRSVRANADLTGEGNHKSMRRLIAKVRDALQSLFVQEDHTREADIPAAARKEEYRNLVSRLAQSEIDLGLTFAGAANSAYRAGRLALGETAHARAEIQYSKASRLADECPSSDRATLKADLLRLSRAIDDLRALRDYPDS